MATAATRVFKKIAKSLPVFGLIVRTSRTSTIASDPTITAGSGAPSDAEPNGSIYLRTNGIVYRRVGGAWEAIGSLGEAATWTALQTFQNMAFGASSELTIAAGVVAATRSLHTVDTEADAASDDLDSITGGTVGEILFVRLENAARNVVLKHAIAADKIACPGGLDITLDVATDWALLIHNGTQWTVLAFNTLTDGRLAANLSWTGTQTFQKVVDGASSELTIAAGAVAATRSHHTLDTEADAASDDLDDITGGSVGMRLKVRIENAARNVVLKHAIGANKIACPGGQDITLDVLTDWAVLEHNGTQWTVVAASRLETTFKDSTLLVVDDADGTKKMAFQVSGVSAGQTRTVSMPDRNVDLDHQVFRTFTTITPAQVRALRATPIQLVAAPGATKYLEPVSFHFWLDFGTVAHDAPGAGGDDLGVRYTNGAGQIVGTQEATGLINAGADAHRTLLAGAAPVATVTDVTPVANAALVLHNVGAAEYAGTGDSNLKVEAFFRIRNLEPV